MSQFRRARLALMIAALCASSVLTNNAVAQKKDDQKPAAEQKGPTVRQELFKLVDPAQIQQLLAAKNFAELKNRITQAQALPNLTPYEQYAIVVVRVQLASASANDAELAPALAAAIDSGFLPAEQKDNFLYSLGMTYYNLKDYPKAVQTLHRYQKEGKDPAKVLQVLTRAEYLAGDYAAAKTDLATYISNQEKAGAKPSDEDLKLLVSAAHEVKDDATLLQALNQRVSYYPNDELWSEVISRGILRRPGYNGQANDINLYRLAFSAEQKLQPDWYTDFATLLLTEGFPTEAKKVLDTGVSQGVLTESKIKALHDKANKEAANDAKTIAGGESKAAASKSGAGLVNLGWAYVTMGQYDKGIGFIQQGIAKGGLKQQDEGKLRLGIAQFRGGHKDQAIATLQEIKAGGGLSDLAKYWILLINHPTAATEAAK
jgi:hypothetical protein